METVTHRSAWRLPAVLLAAAMLLGTSALASQAELDALQERASGIAQEKQALSEQIESLSGDLSTHLEQKALLDTQIGLIEDEVSNLEDQIALYEAQIAQAEADLEDAREREAAKYALFCKRVRAMEEKGRWDYLSVLFRASSLTDLLTRLDFINGVMEADQQVMEDLRAVQEEIAVKQEDLARQRDDLDTARAAQMDRRAELDAQREAANLLILELQQSKAEAEADLDDLSAAEDKVLEEILRISRQMEEEARRREEQAERLERAAAQAAASQQNTDAYRYSAAETAGGYIWPVDSRRITSTYGGRASPGGIGSTNHKGVDIGGVGYGTAIRAAKAGVVIISQYQASYGNYVVVSHGGGNTTLYAHMSRRLVSVGDSVGQGSILGLTGSTGQSTGPHLHFEITENGSRVNPLRYLSGYSLSR